MTISLKVGSGYTKSRDKIINKPAGDKSPAQNNKTMEEKFDFSDIHCFTCEYVIYDLDKGYFCKKHNKSIKNQYSVVCEQHEPQQHSFYH